MTTICHSCGSKIAATRERCPRCRAVITRRDPATEAARSRRLAGIAAGIFGTFCLVVTVLWLTQGRASGDATAMPPADPLAGRRLAAAPPEPAAPAAGSGPASLDPAAAGTAAYAAGDVGSALQHFRDAVERNPRDAEALSNLGQMLVRQNEVAAALPYFERACALNPDRWTYRFNLARTLGLLQRWEEAIAAYRHAQQLFPNDYVTTFNLALTLHKSGDDAGAVEEYLEAIALDPADASFRLALGISYERLGRREDAAAAYREYLRLAPDAPDAGQITARLAQLGAPAAAR